MSRTASPADVEAPLRRTRGVPPSSFGPSRKSAFRLLAPLRGGGGARDGGGGTSPASVIVGAAAAAARTLSPSPPVAAATAVAVAVAATPEVGNDADDEEEEGAPSDGDFAADMTGGAAAATAMSECSPPPAGARAAARDAAAPADAAARCGPGPLRLLAPAARGGAFRAYVPRPTVPAVRAGGGSGALDGLSAGMAAPRGDGGSGADSAGVPCMPAAASPAAAAPAQDAVALPDTGPPDAAAAIAAPTSDTAVPGPVSARGTWTATRSGAAVVTAATLLSGGGAAGVHPRRPETAAYVAARGRARTGAAEGTAPRPETSHGRRPRPATMPQAGAADATTRGRGLSPERSLNAPPRARRAVGDGGGGEHVGTQEKRRGREAARGVARRRHHHRSHHSSRRGGADATPQLAPDAAGVRRADLASAVRSGGVRAARLARSWDNAIAALALRREVPAPSTNEEELAAHSAAQAAAVMLPRRPPARLHALGADVPRPALG
jgi:hypothetical protein